MTTSTMRMKIEKRVEILGYVALALVICFFEVLAPERVFGLQKLDIAFVIVLIVGVVGLVSITRIRRRLRKLERRR